MSTAQPFRWSPPRPEPPTALTTSRLLPCFVRRTYTGPDTFTDRLGFQAQTATERHALSLWKPGNPEIIITP
jgi:hypothetical protein